MQWAALLLCVLLFAACGSTTPGGTPNTVSSSSVLNDPGKLPSAGTVSATLAGIGGGGDTGSIFGIAADDTAVWVHNSVKGTVVRVDPRTNQVVETIPVGHGEGDVGLEAGAVWVLNRDDYTVSRIDPATNQVVATIPLPQLQGRIHLRISLSVSPGAVWVTREDKDIGWRIDPQTNQVAATIYPAGGPAWMTFAAGSLWVCNRYSALFGVTRLDPTTNQALARIDISNGKQYACDGIAASSNGAVWAELTRLSDSGPMFDEGLVRIDPATNKVVFTLTMLESKVINALAADAQGVWSAKADKGLVRINPKTNQPTGFLSVLGVTGIAIGAGAVWALNSDGDLMRITPAA
jgi:YVTN family beta-propeller protein